MSKLETIKQAKKKSSLSRAHRQSYIGPVTSKPPKFKPHPVKEKQPFVKALFDDEAPTKFPVVQPAAAGPRPVPQTAECYFWRTTGCTYKDKCFNLHIPEHKGIALKSIPYKR